MSIDNKISRYKKLVEALKTLDNKSVSFRARESDDNTLAGGRYTQFEMENISDGLKLAIKAEIITEMSALRKDISRNAYSLFVSYSEIDTGDGI